MRKIILTLILLLLALMLCSCGGEIVHYDYEELVEKVEKIEIVDVKSGEDSYYLMEYSLVYIAENKKEDFLIELSKIEFTKSSILGEWFFPTSIYIKLYYYNGDVEHICPYTTTSFDAICDVEQFDNLVNKYLNDR